MRMRERIARAIEPMAWDARDRGFPPEDEHWRCHQEQSLETADAVLDAMREPDEAMASAGMHKLSELPEDAGWPTLARASVNVFKAMIDSARTPPEGA